MYRHTLDLDPQLPPLLPRLLALVPQTSEVLGSELPPKRVLRHERMPDVEVSAPVPQQLGEVFWTSHPTLRHLPQYIHSVCNPIVPRIPVHEGPVHDRRGLHPDRLGSFHETVRIVHAPELGIHAHEVLHGVGIGDLVPTGELRSNERVRLMRHQCIRQAKHHHVKGDCIGLHTSLYHLIIHLLHTHDQQPSRLRIVVLRQINGRPFYTLERVSAQLLQCLQSELARRPRLYERAQLLPRLPNTLTVTAKNTSCVSRPQQAICVGIGTAQVPCQLQGSRIAPNIANGSPGLVDC